MQSRLLQPCLGSSGTCSATDAIKEMPSAVRTVTVASVNKLSEEMLPEFKGNLVMACAPVFSDLAVVGFTAKSTLPRSGITVAVTPANAQSFYQLSFFQAKLDKRWQGHRSMVQDKSLILGCNCQE